MQSKVSPKSWKQLLSYSAAAGLGAFGATQASDGAVVKFNAVGTGPNGGLTMGNNTLGGVPFDLLTGIADGNININVDGGIADDDTPGAKEVAIVHTGSNVQFRGDGPGFPAGASIISRGVAGNGYYANGHAAGEVIGDGLNETANSDVALPHYGLAVFGTAYNTVAAPNNFMGIRFQVGGNTHFGVLEVNGGFDDLGSPFIELISVAWENTPNTPITAPEPGALALLAAGAGAMGLRRRSA